MNDDYYSHDFSKLLKNVDIIAETAAEEKLYIPENVAPEQMYQTLENYRAPIQQGNVNCQWMPSFAPTQYQVPLQAEVYSEGCPLVYGTVVEPESRFQYEAPFSEYTTVDVGVSPQVMLVPPFRIRTQKSVARKGNAVTRGVKKAKARVAKSKLSRSEKEKKMSVEERRLSACVRERGRMRNLNYAYDLLRAVLPYNKPAGKKLSKIECLKSAKKYILSLMKIRDETTNSVSTMENCEINFCNGQVWATPNCFHIVKQEINPSNITLNSQRIEMQQTNELYWQACDNQNFVFHGSSPSLKWIK